MIKVNNSKNLQLLILTRAYIRTSCMQHRSEESSLINT